MVSFNPIITQSTTDNGNKYRKSNLGKTIGIAVAVGAGIATRKAKRSFIVNRSSDEIFNDILKIIGKKINFSDKTKNIINKLDWCTDLFFIFSIGYLADKFVNKIRAKKADKFAELNA